MTNSQPVYLIGGVILDAATKKQLQIKACNVRMGVIEGVFNAKSGHPGGSLSIADVLTYLYFEHINVDPKNPKDENRDRFVLSKGHTAPALYAVLAHKGFFPVSELKNLRKPGSMLQGHPSMKLTPGVDMSTGSLGQGISTAVGMALGGKIDCNISQHIQVLIENEFHFFIILCAALDLSGSSMDLGTAAAPDGKLRIHSEAGAAAFLNLFIAEQSQILGLDQFPEGDTVQFQRIS